MSIDINQLGRNIKCLRTNFGETLKELGNTVNASEGAVSLWESGRRKPDARMLDTIASHYRITVDQLLHMDFSDMLPIKYPSNIEKMNLLPEVMFPTVFSDEALSDPYFKTGYECTIEIWKALNNDVAPQDWILERCLESYTHSIEESNTVESACNMLSMLFMIWNCMINDEIYMRLEKVLNHPEFLPGIIKKVALNKIPLNTEKTQKGRQEFLKSSDDDIKKMLRLIKYSEKWADLADYYLALRYMCGMIDNEYNEHMNYAIGSEMMFSFSAFGNKYAIHFLKIQIDLWK